MRRIVTFGLCVLALPMLAAGQTKDDFEFWDQNNNGDLTCSEAEDGPDGGLRLPAYQDDRDGTGIIYEWLERSRSSDADADGIACDSVSNPSGYIPNVQPVDDPSQGCPVDAETWRGLQVCEEQPREGYDRDAFGSAYSSLEDDIIDMLPPTMRAGGQVYTPYSCLAFDIRADGTAATDIEHIVALAEAHDSGIADARRRDIAADLDNLTIADPRVNRTEKSDRDASDWTPARSIRRRGRQDGSVRRQTVRAPADQVLVRTAPAPLLRGAGLRAHAPHRRRRTGIRGPRRTRPEIATLDTRLLTQIAQVRYGAPGWAALMPTRVVDLGGSDFDPISGDGGHGVSCRTGVLPLSMHNKIAGCPSLKSTKTGCWSAARKSAGLVGTLVTGGISLLAVGLFIIGDRGLLFTERFAIEADFGNVTGIAIGTEVRVAGIEAGEVLDITIPLSPGERFLVHIWVRENLRPLVRTDSVAAVFTDGLLGAVFIQIQSGSARAAPVEDGDRIRGVDVAARSDLMEDGRENLRIVADEFSGLRAEMGQALRGLSATAELTAQRINSAAENIGAITRANDRLTEDVSRVLAVTRTRGADLTGRLQDDALYEGLVRTAAETQATVRAVRKRAEQVAPEVARLSAPEHQRGHLLADIGDVFARARDAMARVADNTEALKRNSPFSGFFADRGFYNLDQLTRDEYRELLRDYGYTPLRTWVEAELLFETDGEGRMTLTDTAAARLDEAMVELLDYLRDRPIVVEGYAAAHGPGLEYRRSQIRAGLVRSYLVRTYRRPASLTGTMPMGSQADGSPSGAGTWDGIAVTILVDADYRSAPPPR
ncbi:MAG: MlaD family protein [Acidobacteria bacterium]|nr:MlaD family protein [Acidobacteriota bacterium]